MSRATNKSVTAVKSSPKQTKSRDADNTHAQALDSKPLNAAPPYDDSNIDFQFYCRACELAHQTPDEKAYDQGRQEGRFFFSQDINLIGTLMSLYSLNVHHLSNEWLVFSSKTGQSAAYGQTPLEAILNWTIQQPIDCLLSAEPQHL
ncbi:MAG: hypothetical protein P8176_08000 [Gammaproteobacteria bacterium]